MARKNFIDLTQDDSPPPISAQTARSERPPSKLFTKLMQRGRELAKEGATVEHTTESGSQIVKKETLEGDINNIADQMEIDGSNENVFIAENTEMNLHANKKGSKGNEEESYVEEETLGMVSALSQNDEDESADEEDEEDDEDEEELDDEDDEDVNGSGNDDNEEEPKEKTFESNDEDIEESVEQDIKDKANKNRTEDVNNQKSQEEDEQDESRDGSKDPFEGTEDIDILIVMAQHYDMTIMLSNSARVHVNSSRLREHQKWADFLEEQGVTLPLRQALDVEAENRGTSSFFLNSITALQAHTISAIDADSMLQSHVATQEKEAGTTRLSSGCHYPQIHFPDVEPEPIVIALAVMHSQFHLLPSVVDYNTLHDLALHCEEFDTADLLSTFVAGWIERLLPAAQLTSDMNFLHLSWVFKFEQLFESQLHHMICTWENSLSESHETYPEIELVRSWGCGWKLHETMERGREQLLQNLLDLLAKYADEEYWHEHYQCKLERNPACAEHAYVYFLLQLRALRVWPTVPAPLEIQESPVQFRERLYGIKRCPYSPEHSGCSDLMDEFLEELLDVGYNIRDLDYAAQFHDVTDLGKDTMSSCMGTYMFHYGFKAEDFGYTSILGSLKRRSNYTRNYDPIRCAVLDTNMDLAESDYEPPSDSEMEPEEEFAEDGNGIYGVKRDIDGALRELTEEGNQPPRKKARHRGREANEVTNQENWELISKRQDEASIRRLRRL